MNRTQFAIPVEAAVPAATLQLAQAALPFGCRSEERRVGKEC